MEQVAIWRKLAEKWLEAADEVADPALKRCYVERAASYERLAARDGEFNRSPIIAPRNS